MCKKLVSLIMVFVFVMSSVSFATTLITGVTVLSESTPYNADTHAINAFNGNGLNINGPGTHDNSWSPAQVHWFTKPETHVNDSFVYVDLGAEYDLHSVKIWNFNESGTAGCTALDLWVSTDNLTYVNTLSITELAAAPANATTAYGETFSMIGATARYVLVDVTGAVNISYAGLSEVQFFTPEPTTIALLGLGALALIRKRRAQ